jgi:propionate CoA-transferase
MNLVAQGELLLRLARWGAAMARPDTRYASPAADNRLFRSPRDAVRLIPDGAVVAASGFGVHQRASILYRALVDEFEEHGRPRGLTVINIGGHGGRGLLPGTLDELGRAGLCRRFVTSHLETFHRFLRLAADGECELQCLPLGVIALLYDAQARGRRSLTSATGVGTFLDPRVGRGSPLIGGDDQLVAGRGARLRYTLPAIDVALFNLPAADRAGNLYARDAAIVGDCLEIARAARRNGGRVIANVGLLVDEGYDRVFLPSDMVDAIVHYPWTEQTLGYFHDDPWRLVTPSGHPRDEREIADALAFSRTTRRLASLVGRSPAAAASTKPSGGWRRRRWWPTCRAALMWFSAPACRRRSAASSSSTAACAT